MSELFIENEQRKLRGWRLASMNVEEIGSDNDSVGRDTDSDSDIESIDSSDSSLNQTNSDSDAMEYLDKDKIRFGFGICQDTTDITKQFTVNLVCYSIRYRIGTTDPFLLHLLQFDSQQFDYPKFSFRCAEHPDQDEHKGEASGPANLEQHTYFKNECLQHALELLQDVAATDLSSAYKGYVMDKEEIFVFLDVTGATVAASPNATLKRMWITVDELVNQCKVVGFPIRAELQRSLYMAHPHVLQLKRNRRPLYIPEIVYLCSEVGGVYKNMYNDEEKQSLFLEDRINNAVLGNFYYFSKAPLDHSSQSVFEIKRYVGFCEHGLYLTLTLDAIASVQDSPVEAVAQDSSVKAVVQDPPAQAVVQDSPVKAVVQDSPVKAVAQDSPVKAVAQDSPVKAVVQDSPVKAVAQASPLKRSAVVQNFALGDVFPYLASLAGPDRPKTKSENIAANAINYISNELAPCIYFQEMTSDQRIPFWCIKSKQNFCEI
jgi:hypothetical protein